MALAVSIRPMRANPLEGNVFGMVEPKGIEPSTSRVRFQRAA